MPSKNKKIMRIIRLDEVESTQKTARKMVESGRLHEETVITSRFQRRGKGRGEHSWHSSAGKNLLLTWVLFPDFLHPNRQFLLPVVTALAVSDLMVIYIPDTTIKWPNDIYAGNKKIAGILIENNLQGDRFTTSLIGVGININQDVFDPSLPNPTSLHKVTGDLYDTDILLNRFITFFQQRMQALKAGKEKQLLEDYTNRLYLLNHYANYRTPEGKIQARITGTDPFGQLLLTDNSGQTKAYGIDTAELIQ